MKYLNQSNWRKEKLMADEKLKFMDMLSMMRVIDDDDRIRKFSDCIEATFQQVSRKVSEYNKDGKLTIEIKFCVDKKNKNGVNVFAEVKKTIPKGSQCNPFYRDARTGGLYLDDPSQMKLFNTVSNMSSGKDLAAQNDA